MKRRKVWLSTKFNGGPRPFSTRSAAEKYNKDFSPVPFIENFPGDVVLSREDRRTLAVVVKWMDDESAGKFKVDVSPELRALLRGGR
jgi:hypothetical protein